MNNMLTITPELTRSTTDEVAFSELVAEVDFGHVDAWQLRGVRWASFIDRQRSLGHRVTIGGAA